MLQLAAASREHKAQSDVCIIGSGGPVVDLLERTGATVTVLDTSRSGKAIAAARLISVLRSGSYDVVHAHSGGRIPRVVAGKSGAKVISHLHGLDADWIDHAAANDGFFQKRINEVGFGADEIGVSSEYMASLVAGTGSLKPVIRMKYGVDTVRFAPPTNEAKRAARAQLGLHDSTRIVGFVGRLVPQKGLPHILALAASLAGEPDVSVVIVGDGPLRKDFEDKIAEMRLKNVILAGETVAVEETMGAFDMTVVTSEWEPFGIVGIESQSMGIPVVAIDVGGLSEVIVDGITGVLVPRGDIHSLRANVGRLLDDPQQRQTLGAAGRARVVEEFDSRLTSKSVFDHYRDLTGHIN